MGANWRSSINFWSPEGKLWSPKFPLPFFQIKVTTQVKNASYGRFYAQKLHYFRFRYHRAIVRVRVLFFFHKLLFGDIKLSDPERRNRKLSAHDYNDHIKTLFSSHNYHETQTRVKPPCVSYQATTVPHYSQKSTEYITYLSYFSYGKQHGGLETYNSYWS